MRILRVDPRAPNAADISAAAAILQSGGLVAFPTETVYGLGANALDAAAVERIYAAKGRPAYNPIIVHVADVAGAQRVAEWSTQADALARVFWPGPLTLVLRKRAGVPNAVTAGLDTVGVRIPAHPVALALLEAAAIPVAAPSANRSTMLSPTTAAHVAKSLGEGVDLIVDGGPTAVGIESAVIDLTAPLPTLLRPGMISRAQLEAVLGPVAVASSVEGNAARPSPGMLERHYSPRARLLLVEANDVAPAAAQERAAGRRVGALVIGATIPDSVVDQRHMPDDASRYAARLYDVLHALDETGCDVIIVETVPPLAEWAGVADRLSRAAAATTNLPETPPGGRSRS